MKTSVLRVLPLAGFLGSAAFGLSLVTNSAAPPHAELVLRARAGAYALQETFYATFVGRDLALLTSFTHGGVTHIVETRAALDPSGPESFDSFYSRVLSLVADGVPPPGGCHLRLAVQSDQDLALSIPAPVTAALRFQPPRRVAVHGPF